MRVLISTNYANLLIHTFSPSKLQLSSVNYDIEFKMGKFTNALFVSTVCGGRECRVMLEKFSGGTGGHG